MTQEWQAFTWFSVSVASAAGLAYLANRIPDKKSVGWRVGAGIAGGIVGCPSPWHSPPAPRTPRRNRRPASPAAAAA
jgi:hypothetical protein